MMEPIFHALILLGLVIAAIAVISFRDLLAAAIAFAGFSLLMALEFYLLQAPDVAIAEAGIGAGLTTAVYVIALRGTRRHEEADE